MKKASEASEASHGAQAQSVTVKATGCGVKCQRKARR